MPHKQQKLIAHSSGGWRSEIRLPAGSSEGLFLVADFTFYAEMVEGAGELCGVSFISL